MLRKGSYQARTATTPADLQAAQALRYRAFRARAGNAPRPERLDTDPFDPLCTHVLVEPVRGGAPVCCFRLLPLGSGDEIASSYAAQFYELSALSGFDGPMVEMGRFCIDPARTADPDILRVAWGAMTRYVDARGVKLIFGCASFSGTETAAYLDAFAMLKARHLAPTRWLPKVKAPKVFRFGARLRRPPDVQAALRTMPPLLRTYLSMGGWVSDHAVVDHDLNTLHVFTGLEVAAVPAARARALRAMAG